MWAGQESRIRTGLDQKGGEGGGRGGEKRRWSTIAGRPVASLITDYLVFTSLFSKLSGRPAGPARPDKSGKSGKSGNA